MDTKLTVKEIEEMLVVFAIGAYFLARENRKEDGE